MANLKRLEASLRPTGLESTTVEGIARTLAGLPEQERVNVALALVEGVNLGRYRWEGDPQKVESEKPTAGWEVVR